MALQGVADTLFIPLAGRVWVSERYPDYFCDRKALALKDLEQIRQISEKNNEYAIMASVSRYGLVDRMVLDFLRVHPAGTVIALGVGLETMNWRLAEALGEEAFVASEGEDRAPLFVSVDFPAVMEARREVLGVGPAELLLGSDITDPAWIEKVPEARRAEPVIFVLSGVLQYFRPEGVTALFKLLREHFKTAELIFDATNTAGLRFAQRYVRKTGNESAMMYFAVDDAEAFAREQGLKLLEVRGFFKETRAALGSKLKFSTRLMMAMADGLKRTLLIRVGW